MANNGIWDFAKAYLSSPISTTGATVDAFGRVSAGLAPWLQKPLEKISGNVPDRKYEEDKYVTVKGQKIPVGKKGEDISLRYRDIPAKAGEFLFKDAAEVMKKINEGAKFDDLSMSEKIALASIPAEFIPSVGLIPDIYRLAKASVTAVGKSAVGVTDTGLLMPKPKTKETSVLADDFLERSAEIKKKERYGKLSEIHKLKREEVIKNQLKESSDILEQIRTGQISKGEGLRLLSERLPNADMGVILKSGKSSEGRGFRRLYSRYLDSKKSADDIYNKPIFITWGGKTQKLEPIKVKQIDDAIKKAEANKSGESFAVNFRNAIHQAQKGEDQLYIKPSAYTMQATKEIMKALKKDPNDLIIKGTLQRSEDGTSVFSRISDKPLETKKAWDNIKVGEVITGVGATKRLKNTVMTNGANFNFSNAKKQIFDNKVIFSKLDNLKNLFENLKGEHIYSIDHIQPKLFGGSDNADNLRFIMEGPHNSTKKLTPEMTFTGESIVKSKSTFEKDVLFKAKKIVRLVKSGNLNKAKELSEEINTLQNNFKNTYKNTDFVIGEPYVPIKTGDDTANYVKLSDHLKLTDQQKKEVSKLIPTYKNLPNAGKTIEQGLDDVIAAYQGGSLLFPGGKIPKAYVGQMSSMKDGGMVGINQLIRPLGNF